MNDLLLMQASKVKVFDGFNRANSDTLDKADTGQSYSYVNGVLGIENKQCKFVSGSGTVMALVDTLSPNFIAELICGNAAESQRIIFRYESATSRFSVTNDLAKTNIYRSNPTVTVVAQCDYVWGSGDIITLEVINNTIKVFANGVLLITYVDDYNIGKTVGGVSITGATPRIKSFCFKEA